MSTVTFKSAFTDAPPHAASLATTPSPVHPLVLSCMHDRAVGCVVGSALGDAVGLYTEFLSAQQCVAAYPSGRFSLTGEGAPDGKPTPLRVDTHRLFHTEGEWTDDTDAALLILLGVLHNSGLRHGDGGDHSLQLALDPTDFARRLSIWVAQGLRALDTPPLGLGRTVGSVVRSAEFATEPARAARKYWLSRGREVASNGSLMRTHVLGVACAWGGGGGTGVGIEGQGKTVRETFEVAAAFSSTTHVDPRCVAACALGTALVRGLVRGEVDTEADVDALIDAVLEWYPTWPRQGRQDGEEHDDDPPLDEGELRRHLRATTTLADLQLDDAVKMGYVYKTLGSGVLLLRQAMRRLESSGHTLAARLALLEKLLTPLVLAGGDADTNACFAGALLGSFLGYAALPPKWRDGLKHGEWLVDKAEALCLLLALRPDTVVVDGREGVEKEDGKGDAVQYVGRAVDTEPSGGRTPLTEDEMDARWKELTQTATKAYAEHLKANPPKEDPNRRKTKFKEDWGGGGGGSDTAGGLVAKLALPFRRKGKN